MSTASTLDQARDFLLLPPDAPAESVLETALARQAEWAMKVNDARAPARLKEGAARKLMEVAPFLPLLETEVQFGEVIRASEDPKVGLNQLRHLFENVSKKVESLPAGEQKALLVSRLKDIRDAAEKKNAPPPPLPPPLPTPEPDVAVPIFQARLAELQAAISADNPPKLKLARLVADANKAMSRLRDHAARNRAALELDELERKTEAILSTETVPPFDPGKMVAGYLAAASAALDRHDLGAARDLINKATDVTPQLTADVRLGFAEQQKALKERLSDLQAAEADLPTRKLLAEKFAAASTAMTKGDIARSESLLNEARAAANALKEPSSLAKAERDLSELTERLAALKESAKRAAEEKVKIEKVTALLVQLRGQVDRNETAQAKVGCDEARKLATAIADQTARDQALSEISALEKKIKVLTAVPAAPPVLVKPVLVVKPPPVVVAPTTTLQPPPLPRVTPSTPARAATPRKIQNGQVLLLTPLAGTAVTGLVPVPLRVVARPRFVIGRLAAEGESRADFSVPTSEKRVSRAHVTLSRERDEIFIADGEDGKKSSNGSTLDGEALPAAAVPAGFNRERTIALGGIFSLGAQHLPSDAPGGPPQPASPVDDGGKTTVISLITGCMRFVAKTEAHLPTRAVWIFTDASIGAGPTNAFALPQCGLAETHARVHFWQGAFWIENLRSGQGVRLGDNVLAKGEASLLTGGDTLHLGQLAFQIAIEP